jgi:S1-C subfamily serine protease
MLRTANFLEATLLALTLFLASHAVADDSGRLRRSVFKISVVSQEPDFQKPWKLNSTQEASGTGFYIGKNRILTNAHVVANARYLTVQRDGDPIRQPAVVTFIAHDCDLAIVTAKDPAYFREMVPMRLGGMPKLRSPVSTIGFPTGGDQLSVTKGIVSRVGYRAYVHPGSFSHLLIQVDSAINSGNSGGPVTQDEQVVGVAFQSFVSAASIGYIIPTPVISRFLKDIEDGIYDGHAEDGLEIRRWAASNSAVMSYYGMKKVKMGVIVTNVFPWSRLSGKILVNDLLIKVNGKDIGVDGKIDFKGERVDFNTIFDLSQIGESIGFTVKRGTAEIVIKTKVEKNGPHYYQGNLFARHPKYFIFGGLVFSLLSKDFMKTWGDKWPKLVPSLLKFIHFNSQYESEFLDRSEFIVFANRLSHPINSYINKQKNAVVRSVNGTPVHSMNEFIHLLELPDREFISIEFFGDEEPAVLRMTDVRLANSKILQLYGIDRDRWIAGSEVDGAYLQGQSEDSL